MTDHDVEIDAAFEAHLRRTFAAVAATSSIDEHDEAPAPPRRWAMVAAAVLIVAGAIATSFVLGRSDDAPTADAVPGWYTGLAGHLPDGFDHVAVLTSNEQVVAFEALDVDSARMLLLTVEREPNPSDSSPDIGFDELADVAIDADTGLRVVLQDGRRVGLSCNVVSPAPRRPCSDFVGRPIDHEALRRLAIHLAAIPVDQLPAIEDAAPVTDRTSLAAAAAFEVTGLGVDDGGFERPRLMVLSVGSDESSIVVRAAAGYIPPIPPDVGTRSRQLDDLTVAWRVMPDGSVWMASSRAPIDAGAGQAVLDRIAERIAEGSVPTFPPVPSTSSPAVPSMPTVPNDPEASRPIADGALPEPVLAPRHGEEIGFGSIGPLIEIPQPWSINSIYTDLEPGALIVEFVPPNPACIAAHANATIGRGGAILVGLWVEGDAVDGACVGSGEVNRVTIPLAEPIGDRMIYTSTIPDTQGGSERAELVADSIIGLSPDDAVGVIEREGLRVRDVTDAEAVTADFDPTRINIHVVDGAIDFASVG